jgi:hypothetical protein
MGVDPVSLIAGVLWLLAGAAARAVFEYHHAAQHDRRKRARGVG